MFTNRIKWRADRNSVQCPWPCVQCRCFMFPIWSVFCMMKSLTAPSVIHLFNSSCPKQKHGCILLHYHDRFPALKTSVEWFTYHILCKCVCGQHQDLSATCILIILLNLPAIRKYHKSLKFRGRWKNLKPSHICCLKEN